VILNTIGLGMDPLSAMLAPRAHSQLQPDQVDLEDEGLPLLGAHPAHSIRTAEEVFGALRSRGHRNVTHCSTGMGVSQFIVVDRDTGVLHAVSDPRKNGRPAAYS
jgi:gamma-glutamyltranspeptidase